MALSANRLGMWSAFALVALGVAYAAVVGSAMARAFDEPITDPTLAVMEILTLASTPILVFLMAALHTSAPPGLKIFSTAALAFMIVMAGLSSAVHFVELSAVRQTGIARIVWPSASYAVELLSWDLFLGLSLICAAFVFQGQRLQRTIRTFMLITGGLCLAGILGPATGHMRLQLMGVAAYGFLLPVTLFLVGHDFRRAYLAELPPHY